MKNKLALVVAVVLGLIAMYGVHQHIGKREKQFKMEYRTVRVAAVAERIKAGTVMRPRMLAKGGLEISESAVSADHILLAEQGRLIGQTINRTVERGEPLLASYFRRPVERLENKLEHGERAITLRVDAITGVAGNIVPGSHVDIIGTFPVAATPGPRGAGAAATTRTVLLLANVTVVAVDSRTRESEYVALRGGSRRRSYGSVTVAATPEEANILTYAQEYGQLTLSLRPPADSTMGPVPEISDKNLLEMAGKAEKARERRLKERSPISVEPLIQ